MSSPSRSEEGRELAHIGQFLPILSNTREKIAAACAMLHHPKAKCEAAHTGGTHSLGPMWGTPSKYTSDGRAKRKKEDGDAI